MAQLCNERARLVSNDCVGPGLYVAVFEAPVICRTLEPGQFVHARIPNMEGHLLRRPFSVYGRNTMMGTVDILYQDVGFGSHLMSQLEAEAQSGIDFELIGPVGNTWSAYKRLEEKPTALLVGGGVGAAPLFLLAEHLEKAQAAFDVIIGAQTKDALVTRERYESLMGREPFCSTDDGTYGRAGFCTSLVEERLSAGCSLTGAPYDIVSVCGPPPLMKIVAGMAEAAGVACDVSLERRMACGVGACLSCVADTVNGKKRVCVDGPIFNASEVVW